MLKTFSGNNLPIRIYLFKVSTVLYLNKQFSIEQIFRFSTVKNSPVLFLSILNTAPWQNPPKTICYRKTGVQYSYKYPKHFSIRKRVPETNNFKNLVSKTSYGRMEQYRIITLSLKATVLTSLLSENPNLSFRIEFYTFVQSSNDYKTKATSMIIEKVDKI